MQLAQFEQQQLGNLWVEHQSYLYREEIVANGEAYLSHFIVRRTPFEIVLKSTYGFFGNGQNLDCSLLYHQTNKSVDSNNGPALEYACNRTNTPGACSVSFRINVLSTQHSNSLFVIRMALGNDVVFSEPIRSVSKPEQIRKKIAQNCGEVDEDEDVKPTKKRARSEELVAVLSDFKQVLEDHSGMLHHLLQRSPDATNYNRPRTSLEDSMKSLIANFEEEEVEERPTKIGRFISSLDDDQKKVLANLGHTLVNLTEPTHNQSIPPLPFQSMDNLNNLGEVFSNDDGSLNGVNEEVYFPESYMKWLDF
jgi:hypothetical protein